MRTRKVALLIALLAIVSCRPLSVEPLTYSICSIEYDAATEPHTGLKIGDFVIVEKVNLITDVTFQGKEERVEKLSMISFKDAQLLATTREFEHDARKVRHLVTVVDETRLYRGKPPKGCELPKDNRLITIRFCVPTTDAAGTETWACPGSSLPHAGDTHATGSK